MNKTMIHKTTKNEQEANSQILKAFGSTYASKDVQNIKNLLHTYGRYFGKMNREMAAGYFYGIFNGPNGIKDKYHIVENEGVSCDYLPGEMVLEIRCSDWDPFSGEIPWRSKKFGDAVDQEMKEVVHQFAFTFKEGKIFSIRKPHRAIGLEDPVIELN
jgi:hypothetical protein